MKTTNLYLLALFSLLLTSAPSYALLSADELYQKGREARQKADFKTALEYFESAHYQRPDDTDIILFLGLTYLNVQKPKEAKKVLLKGLELAPDYTDIRWALGMAYMNLQNFEESLSLLKRAVDEAPEYVDVHLSYARLAMLQGDHHLAIARLKDSLIHNPADKRLLMLLAKNYFYVKDYQTALRVLDNFIDAHQDPEAFVLRGKVLYFSSSRNWRRAIEQMELAIQKDAHYYPAYNALADIYVARWKFQDAFEIVRRAQQLGLDPEAVEIKLTDIEQLRKDIKRFRVETSASYMSFKDDRQPWEHYYLSGVWRIAPQHTLVGQVMRFNRSGVVDTGIKVKYINELEKWVYLFAGVGFTPNAEVMEKGSVQLGADLIAHVLPQGATVFTPEFEARFFDDNNIYFLNFAIDQYLYDRVLLTAKMYNVFGNTEYFNVWNFRTLFEITPRWDVFAGFGTMTEDVNGVLMSGFNYTVGTSVRLNDDWTLRGSYTNHQNDLFRAHEFSLSLGYSFGSPRGEKRKER